VRRVLGWTVAVSVALGLGAIARPAPQGSSPVAGETRARLCALYAVPEPLCGLPVDLRIVADPSAVPDGWSDLPSYAAGAAHAPSGRILIVVSRTGGYPFGDVAQTECHELSHVLLYRGLGFEPPRWLDEGLAMRAAGEWGAPDEWYSALALPGVASGAWTLGRVEGDFARGEGQVRRSYALARGFVAALFRDDREVRAFVVDARARGSVDAAFLRRFGLSPERAFQEWARRLPWWGPLAALFASPPALWVGVTLLFLAAVWGAFRRRRLWRRRWEEEERGTVPADPPVGTRD